MKSALIVGVLAIGGIYILGKNKAIEIGSQLTSLEAQVSKIKIVGFTTKAINFMASVILRNPTDTAVNIKTGGVVTLQRLIFRDTGGAVIGESYPSIASLTIPSKGSIELNDIPSSMDFKSLGLALNAAIAAINDPSAIQVTAELKTPAGIITI